MDFSTTPLLRPGDMWTAGAFRKCYSCDFPAEFTSNTKSKMIGAECGVFKFLRGCVDEAGLGFYLTICTVHRVSSMDGPKLSATTPLNATCTNCARNPWKENAFSSLLQRIGWRNWLKKWRGVNHLVQTCTTTLFVRLANFILGEKSSSLVQPPLRQATRRPYKAAERLAWHSNNISNHKGMSLD